MSISHVSGETDMCAASPELPEYVNVPILAVPWPVQGRGSESCALRSCTTTIWLSVRWT